MISLNPQYIIKDDLHRLVLYKRMEQVANDEFANYLHPFHAYIIGCFANGRDIDSAVGMCSEKLKIDTDVIKGFVHELLDRQETTHISVGSITLKFPPNVLITGEHEHSQQNINDIIESGLNERRDLDLQSERLYKSPLDVTWMLNNHCMVSCAYCYADTKTRCKEVDFEVFKRNIDECKKENIRSVNIIGGDVFVKHNWDRYISYLVENGFTPPFLSTKKPLSFEELKKLNDTGFSGILQFSLDSTDSLELTKILHCKKDYLNLVRQMLVAYGQFNPKYELRISTVICGYNARKENIGSLYNFINDAQCITEWELRYSMKPYSDRNDIVCSEYEERVLDEYVKKHILTHNQSFKVSYIPPTKKKESKELLCEMDCYDNRCTANMRHCFILPDGKVTLCERMYWNPAFIIGDVCNDSLVSIWQSEKALALYDLERSIATDSPCYNCKGKHICYTRHKRCLVNVVNTYGRDNITHPDPLCIKQ